MKYGFFCKRCGHAVVTNNKALVKQAREEHKGSPFRPGCILVPVRGSRPVPTVARPKLAAILEREYKEKRG